MAGGQVPIYVSESNFKDSQYTTKCSLSYEWVETEDGLYGAFVNGSWNGMVRMLIDKVTIQNIESD